MFMKDPQDHRHNPEITNLHDLHDSRDLHDLDYCDRVFLHPFAILFSNQKEYFDYILSILVDPSVVLHF